MKTAIIGLGNPILTDDGVGIYTARRLSSILPDQPALDIMELAVGGLTLMEHMVGYDRCILIDALWSPDTAAGQVTVFHINELPETRNTRSAHDVDLHTALKIGRKLGVKLPLNTNIQIVAVTVQNVIDFSDCPSPQVMAAIPSACRAVLRCYYQ